MDFLENLKFKWVIYAVNTLFWAAFTVMTIIGSSVINATTGQIISVALVGVLNAVLNAIAGLLDFKKEHKVFDEITKEVKETVNNIHSKMNGNLGFVPITPGPVPSSKQKTSKRNRPVKKR